METLLAWLASWQFGIPSFFTSYIAFEQSLIKISTTYTAPQFIVQFWGQMHLSGPPFGSHSSPTQAHKIQLDIGCKSH